MSEKQFRFQDLEIWQRGAAISGKLFKLADKLDERRYYRFAEQLRAATLSITNNIAEGSGSVSDTDFAISLTSPGDQFLKWRTCLSFSPAKVI